jgi:hypothetical protein
MLAAVQVTRQQPDRPSTDSTGGCIAEANLPVLSGVCCGLPAILEASAHPAVCSWQLLARLQTEGYTHHPPPLPPNKEPPPVKGRSVLRASAIQPKNEVTALVRQVWAMQDEHDARS